MTLKDRTKRGVLGFFSAIIFILIFASIFGSDPLTFIRDKFVHGTIIEPYFKFLCLLIFLIVLIFAIHKKQSSSK